MSEDAGCFMGIPSRLRYGPAWVRNGCWAVWDYDKWAIVPETDYVLWEDAKAHADLLCQIAMKREQEAKKR
jgi:hypothetical protein